MKARLLYTQDSSLTSLIYTILLFYSYSLVPHVSSPRTRLFKRRAYDYVCVFLCVYIFMYTKLKLLSWSPDDRYSLQIATAIFFPVFEICNCFLTGYGLIYIFVYNYIYLYIWQAVAEGMLLKINK